MSACANHPTGADGCAACVLESQQKRIRELEAQLAEARKGIDLAEMGRHIRDAALEEAAKVAEGWALNYPVDVFPPTGTGTESISARMARHTSAQIAREIRSLKSSPSSPRAETEGG